MKDKEEFNFYFKNENIVIKTGKKNDVTGNVIYYAKTNFRNILALAECKEKALEICVNRIKFSFLLSEKEISLITQKQAILLAKKYFEENFSDKSVMKDHFDKLSYSFGAEDKVFTFNVILSGYQKLNENDIGEIIAIIYVDLITGKCDMIEKRYVL